MPVKNTIREFNSNTFYHVYNRTHKKDLFLDMYDYTKFVSLLSRYFGDKSLRKDPKELHFPTYFGKIELCAYCLMPNHFHMLIYQIEERPLENIMRSIMTSYSSYYNKKYSQKGQLFQSKYKAKLVDKDNYLLHITRYIHMNPDNWEEYKYSTLADYLTQARKFITTTRILELFKDKKHYKKFLLDYESYKHEKELMSYLTAE